MISTAMRWLYNILFTLAIPFDGLRLLLRSMRMPGAHKRWFQRLGVISNIPQDKPIIWLHAVSLGEVNLSVPLINSLISQYPSCNILVTTTTLTGSQAVTKHFGQRITHAYFPYDQPWISKRFINTLKPKCLIIMETEIWPNHLRHCQQNQIPVVILNARLSQRSYKRYQKLKPWLKDIWQAISNIGAQSEQDQQRFIELGFPSDKITVTGNLKYELKVDENHLSLAKEIKKNWGETRPVWIAASTHDGEEQIILDTFVALKKHCPDVLLILVPRHPQRFDQVAKLIKNKGLSTARRSIANQQIKSNTEVYLIDTIGELNQFYAASDVAFVGGSLVEIGGHNIIEPATYQCAVVIGPHTFNCSKIIKDFQQAGAIVVIHNPHALLETIRTLLLDPTRNQHLQAQANALLANHHGTLEGDIALIKTSLTSSSYKSLK